MRTGFCCILVLITLFGPHVGYGAYEGNIAQAVQWLTGQQNADGSWGSDATGKFINTVEAVQALRAAGHRNSAYFRGVAWLENHSADNSDFLSRRALALGTHGDDLSAAISRLENDQNTSIPGREAWGVSSAYIRSPLDTALVLNTLGAFSSDADIGAAITYLKSSQLTGTDKGWPVGLETASDAFSTAMIIKALVPLQTQDPSLSVNIANGVAALSGKVNGASPLYLQALAAHAALVANNTSVAQPLLANLQAAQGGDGNWSANIYQTTLAMRAFAAADGTDGGANLTPVLIPDATLRAAINAALGRSAMDQIDRAELARLTTLNGANKGIADLTGLEWAVNLATADLRNNKITSTTALSHLTHLTNLQLEGNPVYVAQTDGDVPTLPEWGMILMACLLIGLGARQQQRTTFGLNSTQM